MPKCITWDKATSNSETNQAHSLSHYRVLKQAEVAHYHNKWTNPTENFGSASLMFY